MNIEYNLTREQINLLSSNHDKILEFCIKESNISIEKSYIEYIKNTNSNIVYEDYKSNFFFKLSEELYDDYSISPPTRCTESHEIDKFWSSNFQKTHNKDFLNSNHLDNYRSILSILRELEDINEDSFKLSIYSELYRFLYIIVNLCKS